MLRLRVGALAELEQRHGARIRAEFDHADEGMADDAVAALLPHGHWRVEVKDDADRIAGAARHWEARLVVAERLLIAAGVNALDAVNLAPRDLPRPPTLGYVAQHVFEDGDFRIRIVFGHRLRPGQIRGIEPECENGHRDGIDRADAVPGFQRGNGLCRLFGARRVLSFQPLPLGDERRDLRFGLDHPRVERGLRQVVEGEFGLLTEKPARNARARVVVFTDHVLREFRGVWIAFALLGGEERRG